MSMDFKMWEAPVKDQQALPPVPHRPSVGIPVHTRSPDLRVTLRKHGLLVLVAATVLAVGLSAWFFRDRILVPTEHVVLSLQGSTSLGDELMPQLALAFLRDEMGAVKTGFKVAGKDANGHAYLHVWGKVPGRSGLQVIQIYAPGSSAAFECLAAENGGGSCDIGMASRPINDSDRETYPALRRLGNGDTEHVVALDGIAVIVNPQNPVAQLSIPQLRAIYTGRITNWKDVGGNDAPIELYGRDRNSGTFEMFTEKVMGRDAISNVPSTIAADHQIDDSGLIVDSVMRAPNAIGYVSSPMIRQAKALSISDGHGPAFPPTELAIVTEDYPICRRLLIYDWDAPGSLMNAFVRYVVYKPGQTLVAQTPFVELTPKVFAVVPPANAPAAYKNIASKYSRIGLSFHFSSEQVDVAAEGANQLDNLARVNVLRLRTFLAQHGGTGDDVLLLGFADGHEAGASNHNLARQRAESIATSLRAIGVIVPSDNILDFGATLPVASNENPEGRRKNRRVEVWVRNEWTRIPH